jgi:trimethylamine:corrinoid methyltransferase-like protein
MKRMDRSGSLLLPLAIYRPRRHQHLVETITQMDSNKDELATQPRESMAIKWAFLGTYCSILHLNHQHMSNIYGFSSNDDWSAQNHKITKAKHRDVVANRLFDGVKKNINKANKAFIKTWLGTWKANIKDAIQARKRKHPRNQTHESNC